MAADVVPGAVVHVARGGVERARNVGEWPYLEVIVELKQTDRPGTQVPDEPTDDTSARVRWLVTLVPSGSVSSTRVLVRTGRGVRLENARNWRG